MNVAEVRGAGAWCGCDKRGQQRRWRCGAMNKVKAPSADSGQDRTTFVGALVPLPIKQLPKQLAKCDDASVSALLRGECVCVCVCVCVCGWVWADVDVEVQCDAATSCV
jgi:hypothetical protein